MWYLIRIEADKAWEMSVYRRMIITGATYLTAAFLLWSVGNAQFWLNAAVPAGGYILSTLSLPWLKEQWMRKSRH